MSKATSQGEVVSMQLCIGLFEEKHPQLVARCSGKERKTASLSAAWEVVIDCNFLPDTVLAELYSIDAILLVVLRDKQLLD